MKTSTQKKLGKGRVGKAGRLSRQRVLDAALGIVRTAGLEQLTMKSVASALGCGVMSLYHHVRDRDDLLAGLMDQAADELIVPDLQEDPIDELDGIFGMFYRGLRKDPWLVRCFIEGQPGSPKVYPMVERALLAFERLGLHGPEAAHAYVSILHYTFGEVMVVDNYFTKRHVPEFEDYTGYPAMQRTLGKIDDDCMNVDPFYSNLRRILDGYERLGRPTD